MITIIKTTTTWFGEEEINYLVYKGQPKMETLAKDIALISGGGENGELPNVYTSTFKTQIGAIEYMKNEIKEVEAIKDSKDRIDQQELFNLQGMISTLSQIIEKF